VLTVRPASIDDVHDIVTLTAQRRAELAAWEQRYWNPAPNADAIHAMFLRWSVEANPQCQALVAIEGPTTASERGERVVGCVLVQRRADHGFFDDFCVVGGRWADVGAALLAAAGPLAERGLLCAPAKDEDLARWLDSTGLVATARFFALATTSDNSTRGPLTHHGADPIESTSVAHEPPLHVFGRVDPGADGALVVQVSAGVAVGSPSIAAPIYDPGGRSTVVDHLVGPDRGALLDAVRSAAAVRGDAQLIVIAAEHDRELHRIAADRGATNPVVQWSTHA
jgi:hypothetical protein